MKDNLIDFGSLALILFLLGILGSWIYVLGALIGWAIGGTIILVAWHLIFKHILT